MFGFVIGTLCFIGLIKVLRSFRHGHGFYGHHGYGGRAARRRWMLRWAFRRLATTPAQEKVILEASEALDAEREKLHAELRQARADVAEALKAAEFDEPRYRAAFERQQQLLAQLQETFVAQAKKVHEVLQPDQRAQIAEVLQFGPRAMHGGCGGHRYAHAC